VHLPHETTVSQLKIFWKYKPLHFQVLLLRADMHWEQFFVEKNNEENILNLDFPQTNVYGLRIDMF